MQRRWGRWRRCCFTAFKGENEMDISKHPILKQGYDVVQTIEVCGASEKLTAAVIKAGAYNDEVEKLVDENAKMREALLKAKEIIKIWHGDVAWDIYDRNSPEMKQINDVLGVNEGLNDRI
jgi:hypothetical protein